MGAVEVVDDEVLRVTFHGVRGSTPCDRPGVARYGGNTSCVVVEAPGEPDLLFDIGTGARSRGLVIDAEQRPFRGACFVSHLHWDHIQGLPFFSPLRHADSELTLYAPHQGDGPDPAAVLAASIRPPLFPIGLDQFDVAGAGRSGTARDAARRVPRVLGAGAALRSDQRIPRRVVRAQRRLRQRPSAAGQPADRRGQRGRTVPGRRPADPRRAVHADRVPPEAGLGPLHGRVRGVAGRARRGPSTGAVPPRPRSRRRPTRPPHGDGDRVRDLDGRRRVCRHRRPDHRL